MLWARTDAAPAEPGSLFSGIPDAARFDWRLAGWHLRAPVLRALFQQIADPGRLQRLGLTEVLDWAAAALDQVDRTVFLTRFNQGEAVPYFYEPFLEAFDPELRRQLGAWYTPLEVVRYMVARVDRTLKDDLGIADAVGQGSTRSAGSHRAPPAAIDAPADVQADSCAESRSSARAGRRSTSPGAARRSRRAGLSHRARGGAGCTW